MQLGTFAPGPEAKLASAVLGQKETMAMFNPGAAADMLSMTVKKCVLAPVCRLLYIEEDSACDV